MMRIAEALEAFRPFRGDAIVVPGRGGRFWVEGFERLGNAHHLTYSCS